MVVWWLYLQLLMQYVPSMTNIVSSNCDYVIKFLSDLRQVGGFLWFPPPIKLISTI
jgi:hypothetical protein